MHSSIPIVIRSSRYDSHLEALKNWLKDQPEWQNSIYIGDAQFVISHKGLSLEDGESSLFFHPSMALLRLINLQREEKDRYLRATALAQGDVVLDATLGLASDALISSWAIGKEGRVVGLESSPALSLLNRHGLEQLSSAPVPHVQSEEKARAWLSLKEAARRIEVCWTDHLDFMRNQPDCSFDVVYFDPMFRRTRTQSAAIQPLHTWANRRPLTPEVIFEACRITRKRVVIKERKGSGEFERLGFTLFPGGTYSQVDYGIIMV